MHSDRRTVNSVPIKADNAARNKIADFR